MTSTRRTVGVVIAVHDREHLIGDAVASVLAQTHRDVVVHVVDDGSTDGTAERVDALAGADSRVGVTHQDNAGPGAARNAGILALDTPWIAFCDSDDLLPTDSLERRFAFLDAEPGIDGVIGRARTLVSEGADVPATLARTAAAGDRHPVFQTVLIPREHLLAVGGYDDALRTGEDTELFLRLRHHGARIAISPETYLVRRVHGDNLSHENTDQARLLLSLLRRRLRWCDDEPGHGR